MNESDAIVIGVRPLTLDEHVSLNKIAVARYRNVGRKSIYFRLPALLLLWIFIFILTIFASYWSAFLIPGEFIEGSFQAIEISGNQIVVFSLITLAVGAAIVIIPSQRLRSRMIRQAWLESLRLEWTKVRIDRRGVTIEGPLAALFHAWPTMTGVRSEKGLILFEGGYAVFLVVSEAVMSSDERERCLAYSAARIAEAHAPPRAHADEVDTGSS